MYRSFEGGTITKEYIMSFRNFLSGLIADSFDKKYRSSSIPVKMSFRFEPEGFYEKYKIGDYTGELYLYAPHGNYVCVEF
jgi:hypothetical protein